MMGTGKEMNVDLHSYFQDVSNKWLEFLNTVSMQMPNHPQLNHLMNLYDNFEQVKFEVQYMPTPPRSVLKKQQNTYQLLILLNAVLCQKILKILVKLNDELNIRQRYLEPDEVEEITALVRQVEQVNRMLQRLAEREDLNTNAIKKMERKYAKSLEQLKTKLLGIEEDVEEFRILEMQQKVKKGRFFGKKKFIKQLGDIILQESKELTEKHGTIIGIDELYRYLKKKYDLDMDVEDVLDACEFLIAKNALDKIIELEESAIKLVSFAPVELDPEIQRILSLASANRGMLSREHITLETGWDQVRIDRIMDVMERKGFAIREKSLEGEKWYFPAFYEVE